MAEIILLRHAQASFGTDNYDRLSPVGRKQALWLGEHLKRLDMGYDLVVMGAMARHRETAENVLSGLGSSVQPLVYPGLDEYDLQGLLAAFKTAFPGEWSDSGKVGRDYYHNMKSALAHWMDGTVESDGRDSWANFRERIYRSLDAVCDQSFKRALLVTSGGPVAVILARLLGLDAQRTCNLIVQVKNSSTSTLLYNRVELSLDSFNDTSHLQTPERQQYITFF